MPIIVVAAVIYNDSKFSHKEMQADQNMVSHVFTCLGGKLAENSNVMQQQV